MSLIVQFAKISTLSTMVLYSRLLRRRLLTLKGDTQHCSYTCIAVGGEVLPHSDIFLLHRLFQTRSRGGVQTKTFRKGSEASLRAEGGRGYVIIFNNEPSCCYVATSERRRIRLKADYHCFALREASIRRSQRSNSEAVLFRGTLPRRIASGVRCVVTPRPTTLHSLHLRRYRLLIILQQPTMLFLAKYCQ